MGILVRNSIEPNEVKDNVKQSGIPQKLKKEILDLFRAYESTLAGNQRLIADCIKKLRKKDDEPEQPTEAY